MVWQACPFRRFLGELIMIGHIWSWPTGDSVQLDVGN
jgi:hypothetical protein